MPASKWLKTLKQESNLFREALLFHYLAEYKTKISQITSTTKKLDFVICEICFFVNHIQKQNRYYDRKKNTPQYP